MFTSVGQGWKSSKGAMVEIVIEANMKGRNGEFFYFDALTDA